MCPFLPLSIDFLCGVVLTHTLDFLSSEMVWEFSYNQLGHTVSLLVRKNNHQQIFWVATYGLITCINCSHFQHIGLEFLGLEETVFLLKHKVVKCQYSLQVLHWYFFAGRWKHSTCKESPHFWHLSLFLWTLFESYLFLL